MLSRSISAAQRSGLVSSIDRIKSTSVQNSYAHSIRGVVTPLSGGWGRRVRFSTSRLAHERTKEQLENVTEELLRGKGALSSLSCGRLQLLVMGVVSGVVVEALLLKCC